MSRILIPAIVLLAAPVLATAAQPNMQPGEWKYTTTTRITGGGGEMPERTSTYTQCINQSDVEDADAFMQDAGACQVERREVSAEAANFTLICPGQQGGELRMTMEMSLMGDRIEGETIATMSMSGQSMEMRSHVEGRRVGDC